MIQTSFSILPLIGIESRMKWEREIEMTIDVNWKENIYFFINR